MSIIINPGTGPVDGNPDQAAANMEVFADDVARAHMITRQSCTVESCGIDEEGRSRFELRLPTRTFSVDMPGMPLEQVRYLGGEQNIFAYPRLYVDGSSWVWKFAVDICSPYEEDD